MSPGGIPTAGLSNGRGAPLSRGSCSTEGSWLGSVQRLHSKPREGPQLGAAPCLDGRTPGRLCGCAQAPRDSVGTVHLEGFPGGVVLPECLAIDTDLGAHTQPWADSIPFRQQSSTARPSPLPLGAAPSPETPAGSHSGGTACLGDTLCPLAPNLGPPDP